MAATQTVVVQSALVAGDGETMTITGTVKGAAVQAMGWKSAMAGMTAPQQLNYCASLLKAAWLQSAAPVDAGIAGTVTI